MPPATDRSRLQAVPMRWCNFIDIVGFSQLWESDQSRALHALRELMGAIYRIGTRVYPHEVNRLFVHHLGDGFAIVSDFGEASLERPLGIAAALMRHVEQDAPDLLLVGAAPAVEAHASAPPPEELGAEIALQHAGAVGDGGRGDAELLAGMGESAEPGGGLEESQAVEGRQGHHGFGRRERSGQAEINTFFVVAQIYLFLVACRDGADAVPCRACTGGSRGHSSGRKTQSLI